MGLLPEKYPPSIIVSSGHGLHAYWLLKEPVIINDENRAEVINTVRKLQQIIRNSAAANGWKIDATADLSRILRVPYTWNFKDPENPVLCEVIEYADLRYRYKDLHLYRSKHLNCFLIASKALSGAKRTATLS